VTPRASAFRKDAGPGLLTNLTNPLIFDRTTAFGADRMTAVFNLYDAKTSLSSLVERAAGGEEIVIAKNGTPMARLVPLEKPKAARREFYNAMGITFISDDFDAPLPDDILSAFHGEGD
jgi:prevent-host-death family protein